MNSKEEIVMLKVDKLDPNSFQARIELNRHTVVQSGASATKDEDSERFAFVLLLR